MPGGVCRRVCINLRASHLSCTLVLFHVQFCERYFIIRRAAGIRTDKISLSGSDEAVRCHIGRLWRILVKCLIILRNRFIINHLEWDTSTDCFLGFHVLYTSSTFSQQLFTVCVCACVCVCIKGGKKRVHTAAGLWRVEQWLGDALR